MSLLLVSGKGRGESGRTLTTHDSIVKGAGDGIFFISCHLAHAVVHGDNASEEESRPF